MGGGQSRSEVKRTHLMESVRMQVDVDDPVEGAEDEDNENNNDWDDYVGYTSQPELWDITPEMTMTVSVTDIPEWLSQGKKFADALKAETTRKLQVAGVLDVVAELNRSIVAEDLLAFLAALNKITANQMLQFKQSIARTPNYNKFVIDFDIENQDIVYVLIIASKLKHIKDIYKERYVWPTVIHLRSFSFSEKYAKAMALIFYCLMQVHTDFRIIFENYAMGLINEPIQERQRSDDFFDLVNSEMEKVEQQVLPNLVRLFLGETHVPEITYNSFNFRIHTFDISGITRRDLADE
jgi:hypothetical protein